MILFLINIVDGQILIFHHVREKIGGIETPGEQGKGERNENESMGCIFHSSFIRIKLFISYIIYHLSHL